MIHARGTIFWPQEVTLAQAESLLGPMDIHFGPPLQNQGHSYYEAGDISLFVADHSVILSLAGDYGLEALTLAANQVAADNNQARGLIACLDPETKRQTLTLLIHEGSVTQQIISEAERAWLGAARRKEGKADGEVVRDGTAAA